MLCKVCILLEIQIDPQNALFHCLSMMYTARNCKSFDMFKTKINALVMTKYKVRYLSSSKYIIVAVFVFHGQYCLTTEFVQTYQRVVSFFF